jgi:hypothetical protein
MAEYPELRVPELSSDELDELLTIVPPLRDHIKVEPSSSSEDREFGLLVAVITLVPPVLTFGTAILNFLASRGGKKKR